MSGDIYYCPHYAENLCHPADPTICKPCQQLPELEKKLEETRNLLISLTNEHHRLKEQANFYKHDRFLGCLPYELAAYIFELCVPIPESPEEFIDFDLRKASKYTLCAPLVLSAVCRRWRNIAFATPQLWTNPQIFIIGSFPRYGSLLVNDWLARAGSLPLSIHLYADLEVQTASLIETAGIDVISVLIRYHTRWEKLKCHVSTMFLDRLPPFPLPRLNTLCLLLADDGILRTLCTLNPKQLRTLSALTIDLSLFYFDFNFLTSLELGCNSASNCFEALNRAPALAKCIFRSYWHPDQEDSTFPIPAERLMRPKIRYLEIDQQEEDGILCADVLPHLSCSSLKSLVIKFAFATTVDISVVVEFIKSSGCPLESLSLFHLELSNQDISSLLKTVPTLQNLTVDLSFSSLREGAPTKSLFAHLAEFSTLDGELRPRYLPALRSLTLTDSIFGGLGSRDADMVAWGHWELLPDILGFVSDHTSRVHHTRRALESITILMRSSHSWNDAFYDDIGRETIEKILILGEEGVKWSLKYKNRSSREVDDILRSAGNYFGLSSTSPN